MSSLIAWMDQHFYPDFSANWDDELFREKIMSHLNENFEILDLGASAGIVSQMNFKGIVLRVCGVDPDERVLVNPCLSLQVSYFVDS